jgi:hypothetical protein
MEAGHPVASTCWISFKTLGCWCQMKWHIMKALSCELCVWSFPILIQGDNHLKSFMIRFLSVSCLPFVFSLFELIGFTQWLSQFFSYWCFSLQCLFIIEECPLIPCGTKIIQFRLSCMLEIVGWPNDFYDVALDPMSIIDLDHLLAHFPIGIHQ